MTTITKQAVSFMGQLNEGFRSGTYQDYQAMERLLSGEVPGRDEPDPWKGLRHRPLAWMKPLLYFITGEAREYHLPSVAEELKSEGGVLFLRDVLKWAMDVNLMNARFFGGTHPYEPTNARVDPSPALWNWKFTEGGLLRGLYQAFRGASPQEIGALESLQRRTESRNRAGDPMGDGLKDKPFWYLRLIAYFRTQGTGRYVLAEIEEATIVRQPGTNKAVMYHQNIRNFLHWAHKKGALEVSFERPEPGVEDRQVGFTVNTDPLAEKWNL